MPEDPTQMAPADAILALVGAIVDLAVRTSPILATALESWQQEIRDNVAAVKEELEGWEKLVESLQTELDDVAP